MTTRIERLVKQLDDSTGPSYDARAALIDIGPDAVPALVDALPSLGGFGQLTARTASPIPTRTGKSTGPRPGSTWSKSPAPGPY